MKKIKASEVSAMNSGLDLVGFKYFAIDKNGDKSIYRRYPLIGIKCWYGDNYGDDYRYVSFSETECENWKESLREIDFTNSEPEPNQEIECLIKQTSDWLMRNTKLEVTDIVDLSEYLRKINL